MLDTLHELKGLPRKILPSGHKPHLPVRATPHLSVLSVKCEQLLIMSLCFHFKMIETYVFVFKTTESSLYNLNNARCSASVTQLPIDIFLCSMFYGV